MREQDQRSTQDCNLRVANPSGDRYLLSRREKMSYRSWPEPANDWDRELADLGEHLTMTKVQNHFWVYRCPR